MKKIIRVFLLMIAICSISGCQGKRKVATDLSSLEYLDDTNKENIAYNLNLAANSVKSMGFVGNVKIDDKNYSFSGELILKDSIKNSDIHIKYDGGDLYVKNDQIYLSYKYKNVKNGLKYT